MTKKPPTVTVIIPTYDRDDLLESCLNHLQQQTFKSFQIIVVDNGTRNAAPFLLQDFPYVKWMPQFSNKGTSVAFNRGLAESQESEYVLLLNNDAELESDCLARLVDALENHPDYSIAVPKLLQWSDPERFDGAGDDALLGGAAYRIGRGERDVGQYDRPEPVLSACAAAALYRRSLFDDVGGFDEDFFAYREDFDLCLRAQLRRHRCMFVPLARGRHRGSATLAETFHPWIIRLTTRNQLFVLIKNYPLPLLLRLAPRLVIFQILWLGVAIRKHAFRSWCRGVLEGLLLIPKMVLKRRLVMRTRLTSNEEILARLRESEKRIWRWHVSAHNARPSRLLTAYFRVFGAPCFGRSDVSEISLHI